MSAAAAQSLSQQSRLIFLAILMTALLLWAQRRRTPIIISVRGDNTLITLDRGAAILGAKWNTITLHEEV
ncbi:MAG: hypothetical protein DYG88_04920 [Chloroflexi bacterium CFX4]|nr:hypothetical protein [Chloroflexi bacterium CFX4]MDL1924080.1 hypothetical protein [Chloroflexi bacterium CFX3]